MRLDRFITLNVVRPWRHVLRAVSPQPSTLNGKWTVPVLMYHSISDDPEPKSSPYYKVNTSPAVFRQHMQFLADLGYRTITISDLVNRMGTNNKATKEQREQETGDRRQGSGVRGQGTGDRGQGTGDSPSTINHQPLANSQLTVALTFDDGFRDFYTEAFPVLQEFGFTATMFLSTAFIGNDRRQFRPAGSKPPGVRGQETGVRRQESGDRGQETGDRRQEAGRRGQETVVRGQQTVNHPPSTSGKQCLTWPEVRELRKAGIEFGSHTVNHPKLVELDWPRIQSELEDSKLAIEEQLSESVGAFCYPYAFPRGNTRFVTAFRRLLAQIGYRCCTTTQLGRVYNGDDPLLLKRLPVNSLDCRDLFRAKVAGDYDWLAKPQALVKGFAFRQAQLNGSWIIS